MSISKKGFPPVSQSNALVLILGSMPGEESLRLQQYYAHPRNSFWKIMGSLFNFDYKSSYQNRCNALMENKVALWDVMEECEREGSLDSSIKNHTIEENDFKTFFTNHSDIKYVFFNGSKAEQEFKKRVSPKLNMSIKLQFQKLPSTSPAMAMLNFDEKLFAWREIIKVLPE